jgi:hypothetical protein
MVNTVMVITKRPLHGNSQTAGSMYRLVDLFAGDLKNYKSHSLQSFFNRVANMRYKIDPRGAEVVARPKWGMRLAKNRGIDCKKKSIMMAGYLKLNGIPYRFIGSSTRPKPIFGRPPIHHVFPQGRFCFRNGCRWMNLDATYSHNKIFAPKPRVTRAVVFERV